MNRQSHLLFAACLFVCLAWPAVLQAQEKAATIDSSVIKVESVPDAASGYIPAWDTKGSFWNSSLFFGPNPFIGLGTEYPETYFKIGDGNMAGGSLSGFNLSFNGTPSHIQVSDGEKSVFVGVDESEYGILGTLTDHSLGFRTNNVEHMRITSSGYVGIGTASPSQKFQVEGNAAFVGNVGIGTTTPRGLLDLGLGGLNKNLRIGDYLDIGETDYANIVYFGINSILSSSSISGSYNRFRPHHAAGKGLVMAQSGGGEGDLDFYGINWGGQTTEKTFPSDFTHVIRVQHDGRVGIGTTTPGSYKLAVEGKIGAKEVVVTLDGWSDFVFNDDYQLPALDQVEQHIKQNKHLPGIPTAQEVSENGVPLGEMQAKLLQKIEELTLYVIELKNRINDLEGNPIQ